MWNIPLNWSDASRNTELGWTLFGGGLATQLCLAPYLLFSSFSSEKESEKPEAESSNQDVKDDPIVKHYWDRAQGQDTLRSFVREEVGLDGRGKMETPPV